MGGLYSFYGMAITIYFSSRVSNLLLIIVVNGFDMAIDIIYLYQQQIQQYTLKISLSISMGLHLITAFVTSSASVDTLATQL